MTRLTGSSQAEIAAPVELCWQVVEDVAAAPSWQGGLERVDVVERDDRGRVVLCDAVIDARFTKVRCRLRVGYEPPHRLSFTRVASDDVDELEASWELSALPSGTTLATWRVAVDPGPVGFLARPLERALRPLFAGSRPEELARAVQAHRDHDRP